MIILGTSRIFLALLLPILLGGCALHLDGIRADNGGNPGIVTDMRVGNTVGGNGINGTGSTGSTSATGTAATTADLTANELLERRDVIAKGALFHVEVARTEAEKERGLMYRTSMPRDYGMLFVFASDALRTFWMKDTLIPLDMIFIDSEKKVIKIWKNVPPCVLKGRDAERCSIYDSGSPVRYVLELNAGLSEKIGLKVGDVLQW